jgi:hypothetical protein
MRASTSTLNASLSKMATSNVPGVENCQDEKASILDAEKALTHTISTDPALPPVDRGAQAWLFLAGCYVMEMLVFGMRLNVSISC